MRSKSSADKRPPSAVVVQWRNVWWKPRGIRTICSRASCTEYFTNSFFSFSIQIAAICSLTFYRHVSLLIYNNSRTRHQTPKIPFNHLSLSKITNRSWRTRALMTAGWRVINLFAGWTCAGNVLWLDCFFPPFAVRCSCALAMVWCRIPLSTKRRQRRRNTRRHICVCSNGCETPYNIISQITSVISFVFISFDLFCHFELDCAHIVPRNSRSIYHRCALLIFHSLEMIFRMARRLVSQLVWMIFDIRSQFRTWPNFLQSFDLLVFTMDVKQITQN